MTETQLARSRALGRKRNHAFYKRMTGVQFEQKRATAGQYRRKFRTMTLELLGGRCSKCGITDIRVLQVDHVNGGGYADRRGRDASWQYKDLLANPGKFQLLCANDNWIKRHEKKEFRIGVYKTEQSMVE
jgi:hypothetical protein